MILNLFDFRISKGNDDLGNCSWLFLISWFMNWHFLSESLSILNGRFFAGLRFICLNPIWNATRKLYKDCTFMRFCTARSDTFDFKELKLISSLFCRLYSNLFFDIFRLIDFLSFRTQCQFIIFNFHLFLNLNLFSRFSNLFIWSFHLFTFVSLFWVTYSECSFSIAIFCQIFQNV